MKDAHKHVLALPLLPEQREIARIQAGENRRTALETLFKTLLHHLMTANIRLPAAFMAHFAEATPCPTTIPNAIIAVRSV